MRTVGAIRSGHKGVLGFSEVSLVRSPGHITIVISDSTTKSYQIKESVWNWLVADLYTERLEEILDSAPGLTADNPEIISSITDKLTLVDDFLLNIGKA